MDSFKCVREFQSDFEFGSVGFRGEGKTRVPGEKPLGARERTDNNSTHIWRRRRDLNPGHIGGRRLRLTTAPPLSPKELTPDCFLLETAQRRISLIIIEKHLLGLTAYRVALTQLHAIKTLDSPLACRAAGPCSYVS